MNETSPNPPVPNTGNAPVRKKANRFVRFMKRILYWFVGIVVIVLAVFIYWKYIFTYSDGYRAGLLQKFSRKGTIFKTYEGEMILSSVQSNKDIVLASEKFLFSVNDDAIVQQLDSVQGHFIIVHYREKNGTLPWRGESRYLVDSVRVEK